MLLRSHLLIAGMGLSALLVVLSMDVYQRSNAIRLANVREPTAYNSALASAGLQRSLAALRGWMLLGEPRFKEERATTWNEEIGPSLTNLQSLSQNWTDPRNNTRLAELTGLLQELKDAQDQCEDIANTARNEPARFKLDQDLRPVNDTIISAITAMIDSEKALGSDRGRKRLLSLMADFRGIFTSSLAALENFSTTASGAAEQSYRTYAGTAKQQLKEIRLMSRLMTDDQHEQFERLEEKFQAHEILAEQVVSLRKQKDWNIAGYQLAMEAVPRAQRAGELLTAMSESQVQLMKADTALLSTVGNVVIGISLALIAGLALAATLLSKRNAERLAGPISSLVWATRGIAEGHLTRDIPVTGASELAALATAFNSMRASLQRSETALKEQQQILVRSNKELEQFAYVASHDLQEPLRMVASYLQLLERRYAEKLDADAKEFINYAVDGATRMKRLITDLLVYSRVGTQEREFEATDCEVVLNNVLANLQTAMEASGAVVSHDPMPHVTADAAQLNQLLQNLITNAIKFGGQQPPLVHVGAKRDNGQWLFSVHDNGIGIEPDFVERIFGMFQRLHGREEYAGTGIGLAICKKIVDRHGGRIWVESEPGTGSIFYFTLPYRQEARGHDKHAHGQTDRDLVSGRQPG